MYAGERWDGRLARRTAGFWHAGYPAAASTAPATPVLPARAGAQFVEGGGVNASAVMASSVAPPMAVTAVYPALFMQQARPPPLEYP